MQNTLFPAATNRQVQVLAAQLATLRQVHADLCNGAMMLMHERISRLEADVQLLIQHTWSKEHVSADADQLVDLSAEADAAISRHEAADRSPFIEGLADLDRQIQSAGSFNAFLKQK